MHIFQTQYQELIEQDFFQNRSIPENTHVIKNLSLKCFFLKAVSTFRLFSVASEVFHKYLYQTNKKYETKYWIWNKQNKNMKK